MDASTILAQAQSDAQAHASTPARDPFVAWDRLSDPVVVEGGHGVAFYARRKSTGVPHACYQRGVDGTGKIVGIPAIAAPALGLVPAQAEPEPVAKPDANTEAGAKAIADMEKQQKGKRAQSK